MSFKYDTDIWGLFGALIISFISGFISISTRILKGHPSSLLWIITEFTSAILFGYLTYHSFPLIEPSLPDWVTMPVAVAISAHMGGRIFQELETVIIQKYTIMLSKKR